MATRWENFESRETIGSSPGENDIAPVLKWDSHAGFGLLQEASE